MIYKVKSGIKNFSEKRNNVRSLRNSIIDRKKNAIMIFKGNSNKPFSSLSKSTFGLKDYKMEVCSRELCVIICRMY